MDLSAFAGKLFLQNVTDLSGFPCNYNADVSGYAATNGLILQWKNVRYLVMLVMRREDENSMKRITTAEVNGRRSRGRQMKRSGDIIQ